MSLGISAESRVLVLNIIHLIAVFVGSEFIVYFTRVIPISIRRHMPRRLVLFQLFALVVNIGSTLMNVMTLFAKV